MRFETPPGRQLQIDFGQRRVPIAGERVRVFLFVATLGYSRRCYVATFRHERQSSWFRGLEGAFHHFGGVTREVLLDNPRPLVVDHDMSTREVEFQPPVPGVRGPLGVPSARVCAVSGSDEGEGRARSRLRQSKRHRRTSLREPREYLQCLEGVPWTVRAAPTVNLARAQGTPSRRSGASRPGTCCRGCCGFTG